PPGVRPAGLPGRTRRSAAGPGRQRCRQDHPAARPGRPAGRRTRPRAPGGERGRPCGTHRTHRLPGPSSRAEGRPLLAGEPRLPVRPAWPPAHPATGGSAGHRRPRRFRGRGRAHALGRATQAPVAGAAVAVAGAAVAAGRTLRQPRPAGHRAGQSHGPGAPGRGRGRPGHHPRRLRGATGAHTPAVAGYGGAGMSSATPTLASAARALVLRDLRLLWRRRGDALQPALFAILVVVLFALAMGSERELLSRAAPGVLWVAVLLSGLLALDTLFRGDAEDGSLEQWRLAPVPLAWLVLVRTLMH